MPGIVGLVTTLPRERAEPQLLRMVEALDHETFYATGTWVDEALGVYVGWVARKDSFGDGMPLGNERGDVLVFAGEEFPEPGTRQRLRAAGHRLDPDGPAYLAHLYEEDRDFLTRLNGRFHGLLADRALGTATLFNDRYGLQRLYYHASPDAFYFAAEAKAILEVRPELRCVDPRALGEFLACGCVLEDRTLFPGVHVLPAAAAWTFRRGGLEQKASYFRRDEWEDQSELPPDAFYGELREVVARTFPRYFEARESIAVSLTGGLDTRMILAWHHPAPGSLPCYTFGGMFRDCHDVRVARQVAAACGQPHQVIPVGREFLSRFPHYAERTVYLTDGCADVSHAADLYLNERAREIAPIRMTGNYGGEVLRRVVAFKPEPPRPGLFQPELVDHARGAEETFARALGRHPVSFAVFHQAPWHHYGLLALEQTQVALRSPYLDNALVRTLFRAPATALAGPEVCTRLIADGTPRLVRIRTDRGLGEAQGRLASRISRAVITFQRKAEYAYDYGMPPSLVRVDRVLAPCRLERLFLGRHKFCHFRLWYRDVLSGYVRDMLLDPRALARPYLEGRTVEALVQGHIRGRRNATTEIHKLLTLEILHRLFVDR
jgi:asparagine synthase (glutamine-hydrolysing)